MNKENIKILALSFMIGEIGFALLFVLYISILVLVHGSITILFYDFNIFIVIGEIIGILLGLILFIYFVINTISKLSE